MHYVNIEGKQVLLVAATPVSVSASSVWHAQCGTKLTWCGCEKATKSTGFLVMLHVAALIRMRNVG
jgi:hypothetical protein